MQKVIVAFAAVCVGLCLVMHTAPLLQEIQPWLDTHTTSQGACCYLQLGQSVIAFDRGLLNLLTQKGARLTALSAALLPPGAAEVTKAIIRVTEHALNGLYN